MQGTTSGTLKTPLASKAVARPNVVTRREFFTRAAFGAVAACAGPTLLTGCGGGGSAPERFLSALGTTSAVSADESLRSAAAARNLPFGAAAHAAVLQSDSDFAARVAAECNLLVPEDDLKWDTVEPLPGQFNFVPGDWLAGFAAQNAMQFRGHCLVWHEQTPLWAAQGDARGNLTSHITQVVGHYAGHMHSWDVVNEAIEPADGRSDGLRVTPWLTALGPSYLDLAFRTAAAADPHALLVYNDYGLEYDDSASDRKRAAVLALLGNLKSAGVPVGALGVQAHLTGGDSHFNVGKFSQFLSSVAALGLKILITELDVSDQSLPAAADARDSAVAATYQQFLSAALAEPAVIALLTWGLSDRYTWLTSFKPRSDGSAVRPLPLGADLQPKLARTAVLQALQGTSPR